MVPPHTRNCWQQTCDFVLMDSIQVIATSRRCGSQGNHRRWERCLGDKPHHCRLRAIGRATLAAEKSLSARPAHSTLNGAPWAFCVHRNKVSLHAEAVTC
jgi:hypothetical protein